MSTEKQDAETDRRARTAAYVAAVKANQDDQREAEQERSLTSFGTEDKSDRVIVYLFLTALVLAAVVLAGVAIAGYVWRWW